MTDERSPCSVVLEGGVTSAVIYASLLARLSRHYTFKQLGGASSGAVAAAAAAAAEFARLQAPTTSASFETLSKFPDVLAGTGDQGQKHAAFALPFKLCRSKRTVLFTLFQPKRRGLASFRLAIAVLGRAGKDSRWRAGWRVIVALVVNFLPAVLLGVLLVGGTALLAMQWVQGHLGVGFSTGELLLRVTGAVVAVLCAMVTAFVGVGAWVLLVTVRALRENHWGLCSGMGKDGFDRTALTPTLHGLLQSLAELENESPLTFGDLWWGPRPVNGSERQKPAERLIDLQIISTVVSLERPVRLPGDPGDDPLRPFFYDPGEWKDLFPEDIITHLKDHARPATLTLIRDGRRKDLLALPPPEDWPVLMAARFSLSFPLLMSAVPMYIAVPRRDALGARESAKEFDARKVYFSDGGITSNCPVHLFDAPLPRFPTFGVNLYTRPDGRGFRVSRSDTRDPEIEGAATRDATDWKTPLPFLLAIFGTMFGWRDSLQRRLPGYRERIVHIGVPTGAGGLNLAMTARTIEQLGTLGKVAARKLQREFTLPRRTGETTAWDRHRWTRMRTTLSAVRAYLAKFAQRLALGNPNYRRLVQGCRPADNPLQDEPARQQALDLMEGADALMQALNKTLPPDAMDQNTPQPLPLLHMSPPW